LAREHNAINLSQGFPDFDCAPKLRELSNHYINQAINQYAPMAGTPQLRERVAEIISQSYNANYNVETEITITAGATQAVYTALAALVRNGDEVIVFEPCYDCYVPAIEVHGGKAIFSQLKFPDFSINWEDVRKKVSSKTKAIIINSPHNPSGTIITEDE